MCNFLCIFLISLFFLSCTFGDEAEYDYEDVCSYVGGGDAGDCVPLRDCKPLFKLIRSRPLLKKNLGLLVNLTCEFHLTEPKVCCPPEEDVYMESSESAVNTSSQIPTLKVKFPQPLSAPPPNHIPSLRNHRNFGKIPSFEKCSLSLTSYLRKARGGKQTFRGQFPWVALLGYKNTSSGETEFLCGGTVISKKYILTSAQCTSLAGYGGPTTVRLAENDISKDPDCINAAELGCSTVKDVPIDSIVVHEGFNFTAAKKLLNFEHDIAIIGLNQEITFDIYIQPVCLPFVNDYDLISFPKRLDSVTSSITAGWQNLPTSAKLPKKSIMELSVFPIKRNEECGFVYYPNTVIKPTQICAGSDIPIDCCGNVGSSLMISHNERGLTKYVQVGITSYGPFHCREHPIPGIFTRVSSYLDWILNALD